MRPTGLTVRVAYGLGITGLDEVDVLPVAGRRPPRWVVAVSQTTRPAPRLLSGVDVVRRELPDGRTVVMRRVERTARFHGPPLMPDVLAHPYLTVVGTRFNRWSGRECFHAGVFAAGGRAWLVFGARTAGKSTLLAALAAAGRDVLADDLAVTDGRLVFAGPRTIDLREPLPGRAVATSPARDGSRLRLALPPVPDRLPLGGILFLHWSDASAGPAAQLRAVDPAHLLGRLTRCRNLPDLPSDPLTLLALTGLPAWDLCRPRRWTALPETVDAITTVTAGRGAGGPVADVLAGSAR